ncbi:MAG: hypothetical protein KGL39_17055 [Patescibacteria group bacterium]|nr:hypothetical protein [Patescibacteria group bacterium]
MIGQLLTAEEIASRIENACADLAAIDGQLERSCHGTQEFNNLWKIRQGILARRHNLWLSREYDIPYEEPATETRGE